MNGQPLSPQTLEQSSSLFCASSRPSGSLDDGFFFDGSFFNAGDPGCWFQIGRSCNTIGSRCQTAGAFGPGRLPSILGPPVLVQAGGPGMPAPAFGPTSVALATQSGVQPLQELGWPGGGGFVPQPLGRAPGAPDLRWLVDH